MAKGRMLNRKISVDDKVNKLPNDTARLLFTWIIPQIDVNGCFYGDPALVKSLIFPRRVDVSIDDVDNYIQSMIDLNLAVRYSSNGDTYLYFPGFFGNQPHIYPDKEGDSGIPPYSRVTQELLPTDSCATQSQIKEKEIKENKKNNSDVATSLVENVVALSDDSVTLKLPDKDRGEKVKEVFARIDKLRGYRPPRRQAEAASIIRMLKTYSPDQIISTWQTIKAETFFQDKELFMMTIESQIGAKLGGNHGKPKEHKTIPGNKPAGAFSDIS